MKLNKEKFLKSELGGNLQECVTAWDHWLTELRKKYMQVNGVTTRKERKHWKKPGMIIRKFRTL